jgi:solute carrier family 25 carnitine/acylcarnitine transporter 20/29
MDCGIQTMKHEGFRGLYRGMLITFLRDVPSFASYFWIYETVKRKLSSKDEASLTTLLMAGGMAGIAAWLPCFPQDVMKSRIQRTDKPLRIRDCFRAVWREGNGVKAFYRGLSAALVRAVPANAVTFVAYEWTMRLLNQ